MIKRLSETWKQEKKTKGKRSQEPQLTLRKTRSNHMATSILEKKSKIDVLDIQSSSLDEGIIISPPSSYVKKYQKKKKKENSAGFGLSSVDWGVTDSFVIAVEKLDKKCVTNIHEKSQNIKSISVKKRVQEKLPTPVTSIKAAQRNPMTIIKEKNKPLCAVPLQQNEKLKISSWGLPDAVLQQYTLNGIEKIFPWQHECLLTGNALEGGNIVYSAPTSAGKTLVAEILMLKRVLETKKKAIFILPFVSVAREKMYSLRNLLEEAGVKVGGFMGSEAPAGGLSSVDIAVCTIEKANSIINRLMEEKRISSICSIVVDEMHLIGDPGRGYLLELLLTKLQYLSNNNKCLQQDKSTDSKASHIQIIGMSATLPNLKMIADWLNSCLYITTFRPVPLQELFKIGNSIMDNTGKEVSSLKSVNTVKGDEEYIIPLCLQTLEEGKSVLIFCPTKSWCEKLSETCAKFLSSNTVVYKTSESGKESILDHTKLEDVLEQLRRCPVGLDKTVEKVVKYGVSFHHAGLTYDERDIIEGSFRRGVLKILIATSTLSSGVNLPARRVIIRSPTFHGKVIDSLVYKQMSGRAGRKGVDSLGESVLICKPSEKQKALTLLNAPLKPVYSCLLGTSLKDNRSMKRAILEIIAGGVAVTRDDVERYCRSSYLHTCLSMLEHVDEEEAIQSTVTFLIDHEFISVQKNKDQNGDKIYFASQLGVATLASSLSPDEALLVFKELQLARKSFVLECELHMIYQVTPIFLQDQWPDLDWLTYFNIWEKMSSVYKLVAERVGVNEQFLARAIRNRIQTKTEEQKQCLRVHRRFYGALVLQELVNEVPLPRISKRYSINRGLLQSLQNSASTFAGMVTVFCQKLGWSGLEILLEQFQSRLSFGVSRELCNLVRIPLLNAFKARHFYEHGYQTVSALAYANKCEIAKILRDSAPFESKMNSEKKKVNSSRCIWLNGKEGLTENEAAVLIIEEAIRIISADALSLGLPMPNFKTANSKNTTSKNVKKMSTPDTSSVNSNSESLTKIRSSSSAGEKRRKSKAKTKPLKQFDIISKNKNNDNSKSDQAKLTSEFSEPNDAITANPNTAELRITKYVANDNDASESKLAKLPKMEVDLEAVAHPNNDLDLATTMHNNNLDLDNATTVNKNNPHSNIAATVQIATTVQSPGSNVDLGIATTVNKNNIHSNIAASVQTPGVPLSSNRMQYGCLETPKFSPNCSKESLVTPNCSKESFVTPNCSVELIDVCSENHSFDLIDGVNLSNHSLEGSSGSNPVFPFDINQRSSTKQLSSSLSCKNKTASSFSLRLSDSNDSIIVSPLDLGSQFDECVGASKMPPHNSFIRRDSKDNVDLLFSESFTFTESMFTNNKPTAIASEQDSTLNSDEFVIIDVTTNDDLFETFLKELKYQQRFSICFAYKSVSKDTNLIGQNMKDRETEERNVNTKFTFQNSDYSIIGLAVCWENKDSYYVNLEGKGSIEDIDVTKSRSLFHDTSRSLSLIDRFNRLSEVLRSQSNNAQVVAWDMKYQLKPLYFLLNTMLEKHSILDPKVAQWLLNPADNPKSLKELVQTYLTEDSIAIVNAVDESFGSTIHDGNAPCTARTRACVEAVIVLELMAVLEGRLLVESLHKPFLQLEMKALRTLSVIEINGIGLSSENCDSLKEKMKSNMSLLQEKCYEVAGRAFSLRSTNDIARVLFLELGLPSNGESEPNIKTRQTRSRSKKHLQSFCTSKNILEKLIKYHKLPKLILDWRRVNSTLTKVTYPILRKKTFIDCFNMDRVFSESHFHTATGRVTFSEPNMQNIPKLFNITLSKENQLNNVNEVVDINMRDLIVAHDSSIFLAADYSQLELRLIAHLANDIKLIKFLNTDSDIFKNIAADTNRITVEEVTPEQRQVAKQLCYGILYGIGAKSLSEQLHVDEDEAAQFMEQFKDRYVGVKKFIEQTIAHARTNGYVTTICNRKRYLPEINSTNRIVQSHAERQAVNTTVQGSAADLVKSAMVAINEKLFKKYGRTCYFNNIHGELNRAETSVNPGALLVLQIHDELLYEVKLEEEPFVNKLIKYEMENVFQLSVQMPVKIKRGKSWGLLKEI